MKRASYKIKHNFLFDCEDLDTEIPHFDNTFSIDCKLNLSDILNCKDIASFQKMIDGATQIIISDDIGKCNNPASERYKQFIVRCIYQKLASYKVKMYLQ